MPSPLKIELEQSEEDERRAAKSEANEDADALIQGEMRDAANAGTLLGWANVVLLCATLVISAIALGFAANANKISHATFVAQTRPWLWVDGDGRGITRVTNAQGTTIFVSVKFTAKNIGVSPATHVDLHAIALKRSDRKSDYLKEQREFVERTKTWHRRGFSSVLFPDKERSWNLDMGILPNQGGNDPITDRDEFMVIGAVLYDVAGEIKETGFIWRCQGSVLAETEHAPPIT